MIDELMATRIGDGGWDVEAEVEVEVEVEVVEVVEMEAEAEVGGAGGGVAHFSTSKTFSRSITSSGPTFQRVAAAELYGGRLNDGMGAPTSCIGPGGCLWWPPEALFPRQSLPKASEFLAPSNLGVSDPSETLSSAHREGYAQLCDSGRLS